MPEIDPVILQLRADVDKYVADVRQSSTSVDAMLKQQEKAFAKLEATIKAAADKMAAAFSRASKSAKAEADAVAVAKAKEGIAQQKAAAAASAAAAAKERASDRTRQSADRTAREAERAARAEEKAHQRAARAAEKAAQDKIRASQAAERASATAIGGGLAGGLGRLAAGIGTYIGVRELAGLSDAAKNIEAQLNLATQASGSFAQAQEDVRRIAIDTRSNLEATARLYSNFQRNAQQLGITQEQAARATETVTKSFLISGSSAVEASQGIRQLVQGLQSGVLRGDEFNTVMEAAPRLADLIAKSLNVTRGELRAMAEDGKLTADALTRALTDRKFTEAIDAEFKQMPVTFSQAMENITTAATITFGAFDKGGRFSEAIVNFIQDASGGFAEMEDSAESLGITVRAELEGIAAAIGPVIQEINNLVAAMAGASSGRIFNFEQDFRNFDRLTGWIANQGIGGGLLTGNNDWRGRRTAKGLQGDLAGGRTGTNLAGDYLDERERARRLGVALQGERYIKERFRHVDVFGNPIDRGDLPRPAAAGGKAGPARKGPKGPSAETLANRAEAARVQAIRDEADAINDRLRLEDDIFDARRALAAAAEDVLEFELEAIEREADRKAFEITTDGRIRKLKDEEIAEQIKLVDQAKALRRQRAEEQFAAAGFADIQREQDMHADATRTPMQAWLRDLNDESVTLRDNLEYIAVDSMEALNDGFGQMVTNALKLHGALGQIIADLIQMAFRQQILGILGKALSVGIGSLLGGPQPGGSAAFNAAFAGMGVPGRASGGYAAPGQWHRVNEGASPGNVEGFMATGGGKIIPLGRMNAQAAGAGGEPALARVRLELSGDIDARIVSVSGPLMIETVRSAAPTLINSSANEALSRLQRPRI